MMPTLYHAPPTNRRPKAPPPPLGTVHDALLEALLTYVYLTSELACRLLYSAGSLTYVRAAFKALEDAALVRSLYLGRQSPGGSSKKVFTLSARGLAYLRRAGFTTWPRYHAQEQVDVGTLHLRHHLGTASTLIAAELLCRRTPDLTIERLLAERALRREFRTKVTVPASTGQPRSVSIWPDGYLEFRSGRHLMPVAIEYDRGTEGRRPWQEKVEALLAYARGPFQMQSGRRSLSVAVLTPHSDKRRRDLVAWTAAVLAGDHEVEPPPDIWIAYADPDQLDPEDLFLSPRWYRPPDPTPAALLAAILEPGA